MYYTVRNTCILNLPVSEIQYNTQHKQQPSQTIRISTVSCPVSESGRAQISDEATRTTPKCTISLRPPSAHAPTTGKARQGIARAATPEVRRLLRRGSLPPLASPCL